MSENQLSIIDENKVAEYLTKVHVDNFMRGFFPVAGEISEKVIKHYSLPVAGSHLISPRLVYTHHGLYIGNGKVVHYAGWSKPFEAGEIEIISLKDFCAGKGYRVQHHPNRQSSTEEVIKRATDRLNEDNYNLIFNNCEHFVHWCIYGYSQSDQVNAVAGIVGKVARRSSPVAAVAATVVTLKGSVQGYLKGDISRDKLLEDISHSATTSTSMMYYAALGQAAIPVPMLGALVGASIGYFVGDMLIRSGHIALGETPAVKAARERREEIEALCSRLIPEMEKSRRQLEDYISTYFNDRKSVFEQAFLGLDNAFEQWDPDAINAALNQINAQFGEALQLPSFQEFDEMMESDKEFTF